MVPIGFELVLMSGVEAAGPEGGAAGQEGEGQAGEGGGEEEGGGGKEEGGEVWQRLP